MVKTRNGKMNNQGSAPVPLPKREVLGGSAKVPLSREPSQDRDALLPAPRNGAPLKSAWPESTGNAFPPVPSPFAPPPTLWAELAENAAPQRSLSTIPKRPDTGPNGSRPEEPNSSSDGPITTGHRAILFSRFGERAAIPARQPAHQAPAHQADDGEDEPRRGTLTDSTPAFVLASTPHPPSEGAPASGKDGRGGSASSPDEAADPAWQTAKPPLPGDKESEKVDPEEVDPPAAGDTDRQTATVSKAPEQAGKVTAPVPTQDAESESSIEPVSTPTPEEPLARPVGSAATPAQVLPEEPLKPVGDEGRAVSIVTGSQIRSISRGHWGITLVTTMGILLSTAVLIVVASSIQQFTEFGGLPNSTALLGQVTRTWALLATDGFAQLLAVALPVCITLLAPLYIAFSIQGSHSPDRNDQVTNEQVALQQVREGIVLVLAGLTGVVITLAVPWLTERAPFLLPLPIGGVITCGFMIAVRSRSLENDRMNLARSIQQEAALSKANANAAKARLRKQGRTREREESDQDAKEKKRDRNRASRETLLHHLRGQLLTTHFMVATLLAAVSPVFLTWHLAHNVTSAWQVLLFYFTAVVWIRFFWGYTFTLMRQDVLNEAMKPGNNRLARIGAWAMRMTFELLTGLLALGVTVLVFARLPGVAELPFIVICTICCHLGLVVVRWLYQRYSKTGRGIRQLDRRLKLIRLRREVAELRAGITHP